MDSDAANIQQIKGTVEEEGSSDGNINLHGEDEASRLKALATEVRDQDDLERDIGRQVSIQICLFLLSAHRVILGRLFARGASK